MQSPSIIAHRGSPIYYIPALVHVNVMILTLQGMDEAHSLEMAWINMLMQIPKAKHTLNMPHTTCHHTAGVLCCVHCHIKCHSDMR